MIRFLLGLALAASSAPALASAAPEPEVRLSPAAIDAAALAANFRGEVTYVGNYSGKTQVTRDVREPRTAFPFADKRCDWREVGGGIKLVLRFSGQHIYGRYESAEGSQGEVGLGSGFLRGVRAGGACKLFQNDGTVWEGQCDSSGFSGSATSVPGAPRQAQLRFTSVGMNTFDRGRFEAARAEQAAREQRISWLKSRMTNGISLERRFMLSVELDSFSWWNDSIVPNTIASPIVIGKPKRGREYMLESQFKLASGDNGSVRARVRDGELLCLEYDSSPGECLPVRAPRPVVMPRPADDAEDWQTNLGSPADLVKAAG